MHSLLVLSISNTLAIAVVPRCRGQPPVESAALNERGAARRAAAAPAL